MLTTPPTSDFGIFIYNYQTALTGLIALAGAYLLNRQIAEERDREAHRVSRRRAALRAVLPALLGRISTHLRKTTKLLLTGYDRVEKLEQSARLFEPAAVPRLDQGILDAIAQTIEADDTKNVELLLGNVAGRLQVIEARMESLYDPDAIESVMRRNIEVLVVDCALAHAWLDDLYPYARRLRSRVTVSGRKAGVERNLWLMRVHKEVYPEVFEQVPDDDAVLDGE